MPDSNPFLVAAQSAVGTVAPPVGAQDDGANPFLQAAKKATAPAIPQPDNPFSAAAISAVSSPAIYGNNGADYVAKLHQVAGTLNVHPDDLARVIHFESGHDPRNTNSASGATGLLQWLPSTAQGLGTSTDAIRGMSAVQQLDLVQKYLAQQHVGGKPFSDLYASVLFPKAVGKPDSYPLFSQGSKAYAQNAGLDSNHDGKVTKGEAAAHAYGKGYVSPDNHPLILNPSGQYTDPVAGTVRDVNARGETVDQGLIDRLHDQLSGVEEAVRALQANGGKPTAAYPKSLAHYQGAMQETANALHSAQNPTQADPKAVQGFLDSVSAIQHPTQAPSPIPQAAPQADLLHALGTGDKPTVSKAIQAEADRISPPHATVWNGQKWRSDPFEQLPFTQQAFQAGVNDPNQGVQLRDGGVISYGQAAAAVTKHTGVSSFLATQNPYQVEEAYTANLGANADVGKTVGFNKGQTDSQVARGAAAKDLVGQTQYKGLHKITDSERVRDQVNQYTDQIAQGLKNAGTPEPVAGLLAGIPTLALSLGAEQRTIADPNESTVNKLGAAANIAAFLATDSAGRLAHEALTPAIRGGIDALKATDLGRVFFGASDPAQAVHVATAGWGLKPETAEALVKNVAAHDPSVKWASMDADSGMGPTAPGSVHASDPKTQSGSLYDRYAAHRDAGGAGIDFFEANGVEPDVAQRMSQRYRDAKDAATDAAAREANSHLQDVLSDLSTATDEDLAKARAQAFQLSDATKAKVGRNGTGDGFAAREAAPEHAQHAANLEAIDAEIARRDPARADEGPPAQSEPPAPKGGDGTTGARNSIVEAERAARGEEPVQRQAYTTPEQAHAAGKAAVESGYPHQLLADSLADTPRPITAEQHGILLEGRRQLIDEFNQKQAAYDAALDAKRADVPALKAAWEDVKGRLDRNDQALVKSGRETSASLNARKMGTTLDRGNFAQAYQEARRAKGADLSSAESDKLKQLVEAHNALLKRNAELEDRIARAGSARQFAKDQAQARREIRTVTKQSLDAEYAELQRQLLGASSQMNAGVDPKTLAIYGKMVSNRVRAGAVSIAQAVDDVHSFVSQHVPDVAKHDILRGYAKEGAKGLGEKELAEFRRQIAAVKSRINTEIAAKKLTPTTEAAKQGFRALLVSSVGIPRKVYVGFALSKLADSVGALPAVTFDHILSVATGQRASALDVDAVMRGIHDAKTAASIKRLWSILRGHTATVEGEVPHGIHTKLPAYDAVVNTVFNSHSTAYSPLLEYGRSKSIAEQATLAAKNAKDFSLRKKLIDNPTQEMIDRAKIEAAEGILMNPNRLAERITDRKKLRETPSGTVADLGATMLSPVPTVASNAAGRLLEHSPAAPGKVLGESAKAIQMARAARTMTGATKAEMLAGSFNSQREASKAFGRGVAGLAAIYAGYIAAKNHIATGVYQKGVNDGRANEEGGHGNLMVPGLPPSLRNFSIDDPAIGRAFAIGALWAESESKANAEESLWGHFTNLNSLHPFVTGPIVDAAHTIDRLKSNPAREVPKFAETEALAPLTGLGSVAKIVDYGNDRQADTFVDKAKSKIPGLRETLPRK